MELYDNINTRYKSLPISKGISKSVQVCLYKVNACVAELRLVGNAARPAWRPCQCEPANSGSAVQQQILLNERNLLSDKKATNNKNYYISALR